MMNNQPKLNENGISKGLDFESAKKAIKNQDELQITFGTRTNQWHVIDCRETVNFNITGLNHQQIKDINEETAIALNMGAIILK